MGDEPRAPVQLSRFLEFVGVSDFDELHRYSIAKIPEFTGKVLEFLNIRFRKPHTAVLDLSDGVPWARWCVGGVLNISESCLQHDPARLAVIWEGEDGSVRQLTYGELAERVSAAAAGLKELGVAKGDAVAIHLPMLPETVVALLAAAQIGAVAVPLFSGYGPTAIESRVRDVGAKVVITCKSFTRRGKAVPAEATAREAVRNCPSVEHVVVGLPEGSGGGVEPTDAEDRLMVLYTSGTTGRPKGIVHSHCGFPVKAAQDMCFGTDVGPGTRISWITDIGWMMGPWLIYGALILGGTIVLYDGAPDFPDPARLWAFCERHRVEVLGISPTLIRSLATYGTNPPRKHDLSSLRFFGSTGEPWNPDPWHWLTRAGPKSREAS
jgi:acetyl-CoA synthetase